jgi:S-adenosylmethionine decarboxylase
MAKSSVRVRFEDPVVMRSARARNVVAPASGRPAAASDSEQRNDHFVVRNGVRCAGAHLIVDLYGAERLDDVDHIEATLRRCVDAAGATLLHIHLHHFEPNGGVSGVAVLAESHISIHSWPERNYAALDVFMCGNAEPDRCIPVLRQAFNPGRVAVSELLRGKSSTM